MSSQSLRLVVHSAAALAIASGLAACDSDKRRSPLQPSAVNPATSVSVDGPDTIAPGATAVFTATARFSDGSSRDITNQALWVSSSPSVVSIEAAGRATAHENGDANVVAHFGHTGATKPVIVVPAGTFRLSGLVTEFEASGAPLSGALVEVLPAAFAMRTGGDGRYRVYGVAGEIEVRVTKEGYEPRLSRLVVADHVTHDVEVQLAGPRLNVSGTYTLTLTAAASCRDTLPEAIRTRRYTARLTQAGVDVEARLSGATLAVTPGGRGDRFKGRVQPGGVSFALTPHVYRYYGYEQYPDIAERLEDGSGFFVLDGSVLAHVSADGLAGTLEGSYQFFKFDPAWGGVPTINCKGGHGFVLSRIGGS